MWEQLAAAGASGLGKGLAGMFGGGSDTSSAASTLVNDQRFDFSGWTVSTGKSTAGASLGGAELALLAFAALLVYRAVKKRKGA